MATRIRLRRVGRKGQSYFRIIVADSRSPRDGRFVVTLGHYNPRTNPADIQVDAEQARIWLDKGALPTDTVRSLLKKAGVLGQRPRSRARAQAARPTGGGRGDPAGRESGRRVHAAGPVAGGERGSRGDCGAAHRGSPARVPPRVAALVRRRDVARGRGAVAGPARDRG